MERNIAEKVIDLVRDINEIESEIEYLKKVDSSSSIRISNEISSHRVTPYANFDDIIEFIIKELQKKLDILNDKLRNV